MSTLKRFRIIMTDCGISPRLDPGGDWVRYSDVAEMYEALITTLPYIETAEHDEGYKPGAVAKVTAQIRASLTKAEGRDDA